MHNNIPGKLSPFYRFSVSTEYRNLFRQKLKGNFVGSPRKTNKVSRLQILIAPQRRQMHRRKRESHAVYEQLQLREGNSWRDEKRAEEASQALGRQLGWVLLSENSSQALGRHLEWVLHSENSEKRAGSVGCMMGALEFLSGRGFGKG